MWPWHVRMATKNLLKLLLWLLMMRNSLLQRGAIPHIWEAILREALDFGGEGAVEEESSVPQSSEPRINACLLLQKGELPIKRRGVAGRMEGANKFTYWTYFFRVMLATVCCRFGSLGLVIGHLITRFGQDFEVEVQARFWSWSLVSITLMMFVWGYEVETLGTVVSLAMFIYDVSNNV